MITYNDFLKRGHRLLSRKEGIKEVQELFLEKFKSEDSELIKIYLVHLYDILFYPENIFFDGLIYHRNEEKEEEVVKSFIKFFLNEKIDIFLSIYPKIRKKGLDDFFSNGLKEYIPILIKFLPKAKPESKHFLALYLILADVLILCEREIKDISLRDLLEEYVLKGFARYRIKVEIFERIVKDEYIKKIKEYMESIEPYILFMSYYDESLKILKETTKMKEFNSELALFWIFSKFIFEDKDLLKIIKSNYELDFSLLDELIEKFKLDLEKEILKENIKNILNLV